MRLTSQQMALMSRLLDEALPLDEAGRRRFLLGLSPEFQPFAQALRAALLPDERECAELQSLDRLPDPPNADAASRLQPGTNVGPYNCFVCSVPEAWRRFGSRDAQTGHSSAKWRSSCRSSASCDRTSRSDLP